MDNQRAMSHSPTTIGSEAGSITQVAGIEVGHFTDARRPTGCTVIIARGPDGLGAVGGVDVRGAAPGTRETDLLHPSNLVDRVHAVLQVGLTRAWRCAAHVHAAHRAQPVRPPRDDDGAASGASRVGEVANFNARDLGD